MLKTILSISGRPGLFKLLSNSKNMIIVESLQDNKKIPVHARDRIVSLGDISIYTETDEVALQDILVAIKNKENGKPIEVPASSKVDEIKKYFAKILPEYDKDRVHTSDMRKIYTWYNLLVHANIELEEAKEEVKEEVKEETAEAKEKPKAKAKVKDKAESVEEKPKAKPKAKAKTETTEEKPKAKASKPSTKKD